jgi:hypothetical protein
MSMYCYQTNYRRSSACISRATTATRSLLQDHIFAIAQFVNLINRRIKVYVVYLTRFAMEFAYIYSAGRTWAGESLQNGRTSVFRHLITKRWVWP